MCGGRSHSVGEGMATRFEQESGPSMFGLRRFFKKVERREVVSGERSEHSGPASKISVRG